MTPEDIDALNNLEALKGTFQNYVNWLQRGIDVILNGRPSDQTAIATLTAQVADAATKISTLEDAAANAAVKPTL